MATLTSYITDLRELLHDPSSAFWSNTQLTNYINRARHQVAQKGQCVRLLTPGVASVVSITVTGGGSGYTAATAAFSDPDGNVLNPVTAVASVSVAGGQVTGLTVVTAGYGYVDLPTITISGDGTGATAAAVLSPHMTTVLSQEAYTLATVGGILRQLQTGLGQVLGVQSMAVSWGAMKPVLDNIAFGDMQALLRSLNPGMTNWPAVWSRYNDGEAMGKFYLWPVPSGVYALEVDAYCDVADLADSQTVDLIPDPWKEAVTSYAARLAYMNAQRAADASAMLSDHTTFMLQARAVVTPAIVPSSYWSG